MPPSPTRCTSNFNLTGTSHVLVISGSDVAILATALLALFQRLAGRRMAVYPTLAGIGGYALMVGGEAAVLRCRAHGKPGRAGQRAQPPLHGHRWRSLAAACWALTLFNPLMLWDTGFQLSSLATASPALLARSCRLAPSLVEPAGQPPLAPTVWYTSWWSSRW
jgi:competence protein ComEC